MYLDSAVDQSLIVSLLEHQSQVSNGESAEFFFGDIKDNTGAFEASAESPVELKDEVPHIK